MRDRFRMVNEIVSRTVSSPPISQASERVARHETPPHGVSSAVVDVSILQDVALATCLDRALSEVRQRLSARVVSLYAEAPWVRGREPELSRLFVDLLVLMGSDIPREQELRVRTRTGDESVRVLVERPPFASTEPLATVAVLYQRAKQLDARLRVDRGACTAELELRRASDPDRED
jgi:hypothetical protein